MAKWDTVESDPAVFSLMLEALGVQGVEVAEVYSLDALPASCMGLLFLFQHQGKRSPAAHAHAPPPGAPAPWFARQTVHNACGTQALLHVVLNQPAVELGPALAAFKGFTEGLPAAERGGCFEQCEAIRAAHNSFSRPEPFLREGRTAKPGEKGKAPFHFLAYTQVGGAVYELDGLAAEGAVCLGSAAGPAAAQGGGGGGGSGAPAPWQATARAAIEARIAQYAAGAGEIRFSLLAVVEDAQRALHQRAGCVLATLERLQALLLSHGEEVGEAPEAVAARCGLPPLAELAPPPPPSPAQAAELAAAEAREEGASVAALRAAYSEASDALGGLALAASEERDKRRAWAREQEQRRHNFVPLIMALLGGLAERGQLGAEYSAARERFRGRVERAQREGRSVADEDDS